MMDLDDAMCLTLGISSALLVIIFLVTLVKVLSGQSFKKIILIIVMLLVSNISGIIQAVSLYQVITNPKWFNVYNIAFPIGDFMFAEAHWLFAFYYMKIAKNIPRVIEESDELQKDYRGVFWLGAAINAGMSLGEFSVFFFANHDNKVLEFCVLVTTFGTYVCEIASGCVLIWSVYTIFKYLHDTENSKDRLNLQTLVIHSASFSLFLLSTLAMAVYTAIYVLNQDNT